MSKAKFTIPGWVVAWLICCCPIVLYSIEESDNEYLTKAKALVEEDPLAAIGLLRSFFNQSASEAGPEDVSMAYFLLGESYYYLDQGDSTIANYLKAVEIDVAAGKDKTPEHINILGNLGYMYDLLDQKLIAMDYYEKALKIARETGQKDEIAANLANIAQLKVIQGFYEEALKNMEEALQMDRETGDHASIAIDLNTIGRIFESMGMYDQAVRYLEEALEIDRKLGFEDKIAIRYNSLGLVYKSWQKYDTALSYFNRALQIDQQLGRNEKVALRRANIGSTYLEMNEPGKAIANLEQSLAFFRGHDMPSYVASTLNDLGRAYILQKNYSLAEQYFMESADICRQYNLIRFLMNSLDQLSILLSQSGRHKEAFMILKEYNQLNDSIFNTESQKKIAEFNARYELDKKQQENELLRRDSELAAKKHQLLSMSYFLGGLTLAVILLIVLVRLKSARNRKLIAEAENEKLRLDLEQKNRELTYNAMCIIKNNETVAKIAETLEEALEDGQDERGINNLVRKLQHMEREKNWTEFEVRFTKVHEDFYHKLNTRFPDLTPNEKKLCAFLKLNMSTKDIAAITHQSVHSINVARTRMRKKLGIDGTDENLIGFLNSL